MFEIFAWIVFGVGIFLIASAITERVRNTKRSLNTDIQQLTIEIRMLRLLLQQIAKNKPVHKSSDTRNHSRE